MNLIVGTPDGPALPVRAGIAALDDGEWRGDHSMKNRIRGVKAAGSQALDHIHRVRGAILQKHERHIADVGDVREAAAKRGQECSGCVRRRDLNQRHLPEWIVRVNFDLEAVCAAGGREGEGAPVG